MAKKIKELFASTLDRKPISVRCVFYDSRFERQICAIACGARKQKYDESRRSPATKPRFASKNTLTFDFYRSLCYARKNESITYFQRSMQANRNINLW